MPIRFGVKLMLDEQSVLHIESSAMSDKIQNSANIWEKHKEGIVLAIVVMVGGVLRFLSARDNLWFDEIWSVNFARSMRSAWDVFRIQHDNNHILNTLCLYYFGTGDDWPRYRLLSLTAGTLSVFLIGYLAFRRGFAEGLIASMLAALSYPLIVYSSEARGYAPAILCALVAYLALLNFHRGPTLLRAGVFWIFCVAGFLSHLTFLLVFVGFAAYSFFCEMKSASLTKSLRNLTGLYVIPLGFIVLYGVFFVRDMAIGGGQHITDFAGRLSVFLSPVAGVFPGSALGIVLSAVVFAAVAAWILLGERKSLPDGVFFATVLIVIPLIAFAFPLKFFGARYLAVLLPFLYLMISALLGRMAARNKTGFIVSAVLVCALMLGNIARISDQVAIGRGKYLDGVRYIMEQSTTFPVVIATDAPLRNELVIDFYKSFIPSAKKIYYVSPRDAWGEGQKKPEWLVTHHAFHPGYVPPFYIGDGNDRYALVQIFPSANLISGWSWYLYQKS